jgi:hypothetical protein
VDTSLQLRLTRCDVASYHFEVRLRPRQACRRLLLASGGDRDAQHPKEWHRLNDAYHHSTCSSVYRGSFRAVPVIQDVYKRLVVTPQPRRVDLLWTVRQRRPTRLYWDCERGRGRRASWDRPVRVCMGKRIGCE